MLANEFAGQPLQLDPADRPVVDLPPPDGELLIPVGTEAGAEFQRQAEQAFRDHRYEEAARLSSHAMIEDDRNGLLHLFAAQTLFALGDYRSAAAAVQQGAALLDPSQWGYVVQEYARIYRGDDYVTQMAALVEFNRENPEAAFGYFLRGYHYLFLGHDEAARKQLERAVQLESRDRLAVEMLIMAGGQPPEPLPVVPSTPADVEELNLVDPPGDAADKSGTDKSGTDKSN